MNLSSSSSSESRFMFIASATSLLTSLHNEMHKFVFFVIYLRPTIHLIHRGIIFIVYLVGTRMSVPSSNLSRAPPSPQAPRLCPPPPRTQMGRATLACGRGGGGTQFGRLGRKPGTLYTLRFYTSRFGRPCFCTTSYGHAI